MSINKLSISDMPQDIIAEINSFIDYDDNLHKVSKEIGCLVFTSIYQAYCTSFHLTKEQQKIAEQTFLIITKYSHFSLGKKYACLNALSAALPLWPSVARLRRIATANIPHFILTRCWQIKIHSKNSRNFTYFQYNPLTIKSFSALVQAHKNILRTTQDDIDCIPSVVISEGNHPILGPRDQSRTDYVEPMTHNRQMLAQYHTNSAQFAFNNVRLLDLETRTGILNEINKAVSTRLKGESSIAPIAGLCFNTAFDDFLQ